MNYCVYPNLIFILFDQSLLKAVDQVISPVHLFGNSQLCHEHLSINVVHVVLEVLWQAVDCTVCQRGVVWVQWCETHVLQTCIAVKIL